MTLRAEGRSSRGDDNSTTFQLWIGKSIWFAAEVTTLKGFKVWAQHRSKGNSLNQTNGHLDIDLTYRS